MTETLERASGFVQDLSEAVKQNPLSAALIGMGAVWLFASRGRSSEAAASIRGIADAAQDVWKGAGSNLQSNSAGLQSGMSSVSSAVRDRRGRSGERRRRRRKQDRNQGCRPDRRDPGLGRERVRRGRVPICRTCSVVNRLRWAPSGSRSVPPLRRHCRRRKPKASISARPAVRSKKQ